MNEHASGEWTYTMSEDGSMFELRAGDTQIIYGCGCCGSPLMGGNAQANARLIAAAPDLLAACKAAMVYHAAIHRRAETGEVLMRPLGAIAEGLDLDALYDDWMSKAQTAISKARGHAQSPHNPNPSVT